MAQKYKNLMKQSCRYTLIPSVKPKLINTSSRINYIGYRLFTLLTRKLLVFLNFK